MESFTSGSEAPLGIHSRTAQSEAASGYVFEYGEGGPPPIGDDLPVPHAEVGVRVDVAEMVGLGQGMGKGVEVEIEYLGEWGSGRHCRMWTASRVG